jgi:hypothetical protein
MLTICRVCDQAIFLRRSLHIGMSGAEMRHATLNRLRLDPHLMYISSSTPGVFRNTTLTHTLTMPVNTLSAAIHITPSNFTFKIPFVHWQANPVFIYHLAVIKTFIKHSKRKRKKLQQGQLEELSTDNILYDEYGNTLCRWMPAACLCYRQ